MAKGRNLCEPRNRFLVFSQSMESCDPHSQQVERDTGGDATERCWTETLYTSFMYHALTPSITSPRAFQDRKRRNESVGVRAYDCMRRPLRYTDRTNQSAADSVSESAPRPNHLPPQQTVVHGGQLYKWICNPVALLSRSLFISSQAEANKHSTVPLIFESHAFPPPRCDWTDRPTRRI